MKKIISSKIIIGGKTVDKITENLMKKFIQEYDINNNFDIARKFEYFVNYCVIFNETGIATYELDEFTTGDSAQGIDGIGIVVNNKIVNSKSDIDNLITNSKSINVKFIMQQSKTSETFVNGDILNFLTFVNLFFGDENSVFVTDEMKKFLELKEYVFMNSAYMTKNPTLVLYYVTTGNWQEDQTLTSVIESHRKTIIESNLFSDVIFKPCGAQEIQELYRRTCRDISAEFKFEKSVTSTATDNVIVYNGVLPFSEFKKIIIDENDNLMEIFDGNIRDFLGNVNVNKDIEQTLKSDEKNMFYVYNNGITIVAEEHLKTGDKMRIEKYQIVNGCQTSNMLYLNRHEENIDEVLIPIRIIITKDDNIKNNITKSTNFQSSIKREQLISLSNYQIKLELYYDTFEGEQKLYYERRTGQYRTQNIVKTKIVNIATQIKSYIAMFLNDPSGVSGQYGSTSRKHESSIFGANDKEIIYYTSAYALYKIESLFRNGLLDKKYNRTRYHALMVFRLIIGGYQKPRNNSREMEKYCQKILDTLNSEECVDIFKKIIEYIIKFDEINLDDRKVFERKDTTTIILNDLKNKQYTI